MHALMGSLLLIHAIVCTTFFDRALFTYLFIYSSYSSTALMRLIKYNGIWQFITQIKSPFQITSTHPFFWRTFLAYIREAMNCTIFLYAAFQNLHA